MPNYELHLDDKDWSAAQTAAKIAKRNGKTPPFILRKEEILKERKYLKIPLLDINHDIFVIAANNKVGFKVGIAANVEAYFPKEYLTEVADIYASMQAIKDEDKAVTKKVQDEGYLGRGAVGFVRVIKWDDGTCDAVKTQIINRSEQNLAVLKSEENEEQALRVLQRLRAFFVATGDNKKVKVPGSLEQEIEIPSYTIEKLIPGKMLKLYFRDIARHNIVASDKQKINLALQIAYAVKELHDKNVLHGDLHAGNLMISYDNSVIMVHAIDFGTSKILSDSNVLRADIYPLLHNVFEHEDFGLKLIKIGREFPIAKLIHDAQEGGSVQNIDQVIARLEEIYQLFDNGVPDKPLEFREQSPHKVTKKVKRWYDDSVLQQQTATKINTGDQQTILKDDSSIKKHTLRVSK